MPRRSLLVVPVAVLLAGGAVWFAMPGGASTRCSTRGTPIQIAACEGRTLPKSAHVLSPRIARAAPPASGAYGGTSVIPNSDIAFASESVGWLVGEVGGGPGVDNDLSAGPQNEIWPGTEIQSTSNGGSSWSDQLSAPNGIWGIDALNASDVWAVGVSTLYRSLDGGASWVQMVSNEPASSALLNVDFVSPTLGVGITTSAQLVVTTDGGADWTPSTLPVGSVSDMCTQGTSVIAAEGSGAVWSSPVAGGSFGAWTKAYVPQSSDSAVQTIATVGCSPTGSAWEQVTPINEQVSGGTTLTASSSPSGEWSAEPQSAAATTLSVGEDLVPVTASEAPLLLAGSNSDSGVGIYTGTSSGGFQSASGNGTLFELTNDNAGVAFHGATFVAGGYGWVYADIVQQGSTTPSESSVSDTSVVYKSTSDGASWTQASGSADLSWTP
jgi:photosystem II stability/assembly factor-like uncharacterized protein